jgi:hypothetical protein
MNEDRLACGPIKDAMSPPPLPVIVLMLTTLAFSAKEPPPVQRMACSEAACLRPPPPPPQPTSPQAAADDYRIKLDGVTADAYPLPPPAQGTAHAKSMAHGIVGKALDP